nr:hypothetical protein [Tanacetum cinerariifolium]
KHESYCTQQATLDNALVSPEKRLKTKRCNARIAFSKPQREETYQYEALIPDDMINQDIKDSKAYKTYYDFATGKVPHIKARKDTPGVSVSKKKAQAKGDRGKGIELLSDAALLETSQAAESRQPNIRGVRWLSTAARGVRWLPTAASRGVWFGCRGSSPLGGCLFEAAEAAGACLF